MRQTGEEIRRLWSLRGLEPRSRDESFKLMMLIEAQRQRDEARGALLRAEMVLDDARRAMDEPARVFRDPGETLRDPPKKPQPPTAFEKQRQADLFERIAARTKAFFTRNRGR